MIIYSNTYSNTWKEKLRLVWECYQQNVFTNHIYIYIYIYILNIYALTDLAFNNPQWLICHKTKPNQKKKDVAFLYLSIYLYIYIYIYIHWNSTDCIFYIHESNISCCRVKQSVIKSRWRPKGSLFNNYYAEVKRGALLLSLDYSTLSYLPTPQLGKDMTQGQFFKQSLTGLNSEFSFS